MARSFTCILNNSNRDTWYIFYLISDLAIENGTACRNDHRLRRFMRGLRQLNVGKMKQVS